MPALAAFIGTLFTSLLTFFGLYLTKRIAIIAVVLTMITAVVTAFTLAMSGILQGLQNIYPTGGVALGLALLPSNTDTCIAAVVTTHITAWAYSWNTRILQYKLF